MSDTQTFPLAVVLSVTARRQCCLVEELYGLLAHMTGERPAQHQVPRFMEECRPWLLRQFPVLESVGAEELAWLDRLLLTRPTSKEAVQAWLQMQIEQGVPEDYAVAPIPDEAHDRRDPVAELEAMMGKDRVIIAIREDDDEYGEDEDDE